MLRIRSVWVSNELREREGRQRAGWRRCPVGMCHRVGRSTLHDGALEEPSSTDEQGRDDEGTGRFSEASHSRRRAAKGPDVRLDLGMGQAQRVTLFVLASCTHPLEHRHAIVQAIVTTQAPGVLLHEVRVREEAWKECGSAS